MASRNKAGSFAHGAPRRRPDRYRISVELPDEPARGRPLDRVSYAGAGAERVCMADAGFTPARPTAGAGRGDFRSTLPGKMDHGVGVGDCCDDVVRSLSFRNAFVGWRFVELDLPLVGRTEPGEPQARLHLPRRPDSQLCRDESLFLAGPRIPDWCGVLERHRSGPALDRMAGDRFEAVATERRAIDHAVPPSGCANFARIGEPHDAFPMVWARPGRQPINWRGLVRLVRAGVGRRALRGVPVGRAPRAGLARIAHRRIDRRRHGLTLFQSRL